MILISRFSTRLLLVALALALVASLSVAVAQEAISPALTSSYRGTKDKILAKSSWGNLSEADLYLYLLMTKQDSPLLYQQFCQAAAGPELDALRARLENVIRNWAVAQSLAASSSAPLSDPLDKIRLRLLEQPVHELVWIDQVIAPQVKVEAQDVRKYMVENPETSMQAGKAQVRCILLKLDPKADTTEVRKVEAKMNRLREQVMSGEIGFEDAARQYSQDPSAAEGGLMPEFAEGAHFVTFEDKAFALKKDEISPVVYGMDGLYLLQGVSKTSAETVTTQPVEEVVQKRLYFTQLQHRYTYELWKMRAKANLSNRAGIIDTLNPKATVLKANKLDLTRDQVWSLFPEFSGLNFVMNKALLSTQVDRVISLELIAQYNAKHKLGWQPPLALARQMALVILKAQNRMADISRQAIPAEPAQLQEYVAQHAPSFQTALGNRFSLVQVRLADAKGMSVARRKWEIDRMRKAMEGLRESCCANTLDETAAAWKGRAMNPGDMIPAQIAEELSRQTDESTEVITWNSTQSDQALPKSTRALVAKVKVELPQHMAAKTRCLPIVEDDKSLTLIYVEQPDWIGPGIVKAYQLPLQQMAARFAVGEVIEKTKAEQLANNQLTIQLAQ